MEQQWVKGEEKNEWKTNECKQKGGGGTKTHQLATEEEVKPCLKNDSFQTEEFSDLVRAGAEQSVIKR